MQINDRWRQAVDFQKLSSMNQLMGLSAQNIHPMLLHLPEQWRNWTALYLQCSRHWGLHCRHAQAQYVRDRGQLIYRGKSVAHNPGGLDLTDVSVSDSGWYQWALIPPSSHIWNPQLINPLPLGSGSPFYLTTELHALVFASWVDLRLIYGLTCSRVLHHLLLSAPCLCRDPRPSHTLQSVWNWYKTWNLSSLDMTEWPCLSGRLATFLAMAKIVDFCKASLGACWNVVNGQVHSCSFP